MVENRRSPLVQGYLPERGMLAHLLFTVLENPTDTSVPDFHPSSEQIKCEASLCEVPSTQT